MRCALAHGWPNGLLYLQQLCCVKGQARTHTHVLLGVSGQEAEMATGHGCWRAEVRVLTRSWRKELEVDQQLLHAMHDPKHLHQHSATHVQCTSC